MLLGVEPAEQPAQQILAAYPGGTLLGRISLVESLLHQVEGLPGHQRADPHNAEVHAEAVDLDVVTYEPTF